MITALVRTCGLRASVIPDEEMKLGQELLRARRIVVNDDEIRVFHSGGEMTLIKAEISLLVLGELRNIRVDYTEGISGSRGQSGSVLESSEYRSDETLLDVYAASLGQTVDESMLLAALGLAIDGGAVILNALRALRD